MISLLESVFHGILDIPYLVVGLFVMALNGWIAAMGLLISGLVALLPGFPELPTIPSEVAHVVAWFVPLSPILAVFSLLLVTWASFMALKIGLNWAKVNV